MQQFYSPKWRVCRTDRNEGVVVCISCECRWRLSRRWTRWTSHDYWTRPGRRGLHTKISCEQHSFSYRQEKAMRRGKRTLNVKGDFAAEQNPLSIHCVTWLFRSHTRELQGGSLSQTACRTQTAFPQILESATIRC